MRGHLENDPDGFVGEALVQGAHIRALALVDEGHLLADKEFAQFIVRDIDLRLGQNGGVGRLAKELHEEIQFDRAVEHPRTH